MGDFVTIFASLRAYSRFVDNTNVDLRVIKNRVYQDEKGKRGALIGVIIIDKK